MAATTKIWNPLEGKPKPIKRERSVGHGIARYDRRSTTGTTGIDRELSYDGSTPIVADTSGNVIPSSTVQSLGTKTSPWKGGDFDLIVRSGAFDSAQLFDNPVQIGGLWWPGKKSGTATAPTAVPAQNQTTTGGTIAAGTYYFKVTGVNRKGETTGSPTLTLVVPAGATNSINVIPGDFTFATGYYGFRVYASSDNITFYRQEMFPVAGDFFLESAAPYYTHYVKMGASLFPGLLQSLTFSGTTIPTTNTATIDPLQVAMNQTLPADPSTQPRRGMVFMPAITGSSLQLTTPLIMTRGQRLVGSASSGGGALSGASQSDIVGSSAWNDTKLATVMSFGGDPSIENVSIRGNATNGFMLLSGAAYQAGFGGTNVKNCYIQVIQTSALYSAFVGIGTLMYELYFDSVSMRGDRSIVEYRNIAGGEHYYRNGRWDAGGQSFMRLVPGWGDPDTGFTSSFAPIGIGKVDVENIRTEIGTGVLWDVPGIHLTLNNVETADAAIGVGTEAVAIIGQITGYGANVITGSLTLINTSLPAAANAEAGIKRVGGGNSTRITLVGSSSIGGGLSTGPRVGINAANIQLFLSLSPFDTNFTMNPNASGNAVLAVNVPNNSRITGGGGGGDLATEGGQWFEIPDRLVFNPFYGNNDWRRNLRMSLQNKQNQWGVADNLAGMHVFSSDDTTPLWAVVSSGLMWVRGNARIQATAGGTPQFFIGPSSSTSATGAVALRNNDSINWRNFANGADIAGWRVNASDEMESQAPNGIIPLATGTTLGKTGKLFNLNGFPTSQTGTASSVTVRDASGRLTSKRFITDGTALVAGDFALGAGWGVGSTVTAITGTDMAWNITVTAAGVPAANPTVTLTFKDGTFTNVPICVTKWNGGTGAAAFVQDAPTATTNVITFLALPIAGLTYVLSGYTIGR